MMNLKRDTIKKAVTLSKKRFGRTYKELEKYDKGTGADPKRLSDPESIRRYLYTNFALN